MNKNLKGVVVGAGYFSHFHYEAWSRIPEVQITALSDLDSKKASAIADYYQISNSYTSYKEMILNEKPDFIDIITPPDTHAGICKYAADQGVHIICQKPVTPSFLESENLINYIRKKGVRFIIHENFRFQPWHREIKKILNHGAIGNLFNLNFRTRMGDGWGTDAYKSRQPYFRDYKRLLIYETGVHYIDVFRYHAGNVKSVYTIMNKRNPVIKGEDSCLMFLNFENKVHALWDASRYNENNHNNPRYTFGEYLIDGSKGSIRLYSNGTITIQELGKKEKEHDYIHNDNGFAGDCCYIFQKNAIASLISGNIFETEASNYLKNLQIQEVVYQSAKENRIIAIP